MSYISAVTLSIAGFKARGEWLPTPRESPSGSERCHGPDGLDAQRMFDARAIRNLASEYRDMNSHETRILLIDDDTGDAFMTRETLARIGERSYDVEHASSLVAAKEKLDAVNYDVVLLDLNLPESTGINTLRKLQEMADPKTPVIVLTGLDDESTALQMLAEGAADYLCKQDVRCESLSRSIQYTLRRQQLLGELHSANNMLQEKNQRLAQLYDTAQQFVDNVSHEFRTPLTVIREFTSIVRDGLDGPVTQRQAEHLEKVLHRTDDLALMVDDMLDISKLEAGLLAVWRRPCQVQDLISNVSSVLDGRARSRGIVFSVEIEPNLPDVLCDDEKARRVLINLAINAIKFTPEGGQITIWAKASADGADVVLGVTDTGAGISEENLQAIFGRFRQVDSGIHSSTKGFGLGLSIAQQLVYLNLGTIDVESQVGVGSTFRFTLPVNNVDKLLNRYLDRFVEKHQGGGMVVAIQAHIEPSEGMRNSTAVVDEFLQRALRGSDLVVHVQDNQWLLAQSCTEQESIGSIKRMQSDWQSFTRNCPGIELPDILFQPIGVWQLPHERDDLLLAVGARGQSVSSPTKHVSHAKPRAKTVLVVDDNKDVSRCLSVRLEAAGYRVTTAYDGEAGYEKAVADLPDAVVLDVCMPKKDGLTVLRELRIHHETKDTPIVMLSASIRDQHGALESGANFFVQKPYQSSEVLTALESSLASSQEQAGSRTKTKTQYLEPTPV